MLKAKLSDYIPQNTNFFDLFKSKLGINLYIEPDGTYIGFDSVDDAKTWCVYMLMNHHDAGILVGNETDSLIKKYGMFRINRGLWHIIVYALEGKIIYQSGKWIINLKDNEKTDVKKWLKEYDL